MVLTCILLPSSQQIITSIGKSTGYNAGLHHRSQLQCQSPSCLSVRHWRPTKTLNPKVALECDQLLLDWQPAVGMTSSCQGMPQIYLSGISRLQNPMSCQNPSPIHRAFADGTEVPVMLVSQIPVAGLQPVLPRAFSVKKPRRPCHTPVSPSNPVISTMLDAHHNEQEPSLTPHPELHANRCQQFPVNDLSSDTPCAPLSSKRRVLRSVSKAESAAPQASQTAKKASPAASTATDMPRPSKSHVNLSLPSSAHGRSTHQPSQSTLRAKPLSPQPDVVANAGTEQALQMATPCSIPVASSQLQPTQPSCHAPSSSNAQAHPELSSNSVQPSASRAFQSKDESQMSAVAAEADQTSSVGRPLNRSLHRLPSDLMHQGLGLSGSEAPGRSHHALKSELSCKNSQPGSQGGLAPLQTLTFPSATQQAPSTMTASALFTIDPAQQQSSTWPATPMPMRKSSVPQEHDAALQPGQHGSSCEVHVTDAGIPGQQVASKAADACLDMPPRPTPPPQKPSDVDFLGAAPAATTLIAARLARPRTKHELAQTSHGTAGENVLAAVPPATALPTANLSPPAPEHETTLASQQRLPSSPARRSPLGSGNEAMQHAGFQSSDMPEPVQPASPIGLSRETYHNPGSELTCNQSPPALPQSKSFQMSALHMQANQGSHIASCSRLDPALSKPAPGASGTIHTPEVSPLGMHRYMRRPDADPTCQAEHVSQAALLGRTDQHVAVGNRPANGKPGLASPLHTSLAIENAVDNPISDDSPMTLWQGPCFGRSSLDAVMPPSDAAMSIVTDHDVYNLPSQTARDDSSGPSMLQSSVNSGMPSLQCGLGQLLPHDQPCNPANCQPAGKESTVCSSRDPRRALHPDSNRSFGLSTTPASLCSMHPETSSSLQSSLHTQLVDAPHGTADLPIAVGTPSLPCTAGYQLGLWEDPATSQMPPQPPLQTSSQQDVALTALFGGLSPLSDGDLAASPIDQYAHLDNPSAPSSGRSSQLWLLDMYNQPPSCLQDLSLGSIYLGGPGPSMMSQDNLVPMGIPPNSSLLSGQKAPTEPNQAHGFNLEILQGPDLKSVTGPDRFRRRALKRAHQQSGGHSNGLPPKMLKTSNCSPAIPLPSHDGVQQPQAGMNPPSQSHGSGAQKQIRSGSNQATSSDNQHGMDSSPPVASRGGKQGGKGFGKRQGFGNGKRMGTTSRPGSPAPFSQISQTSGVSKGFSGVRKMGSAGLDQPAWQAAGNWSDKHSSITANSATIAAVPGESLSILYHHLQYTQCLKLSRVRPKFKLKETRVMVLDWLHLPFCNH